MLLAIEINDKIIFNKVNFFYQFGHCTPIFLHWTVMPGTLGEWGLVTIICMQAIMVFLSTFIKLMIFGHFSWEFLEIFRGNFSSCYKETRYEFDGSN